MKQRNIILIAVAVGCGSVAALLTMNVLSAKGTKEKETVDVPVAAKDIPIGTKFPKADSKEFADLVKFQKFPKDAVPPAAVATPEELSEKRVTRMIRNGDSFNTADVSVNGFLTPPEGYSMMTVRCALDEGVAGFAVPGTHVDVIGAVQMKKSQKYVVFPLFLDMLVLAIDTSPSPPASSSSKDGQSGSGAGFASVSMVSFAVTPEQSLLLQGAVVRGAKLRLALPNQEKKDGSSSRYNGLTLTNQQVWELFSDKDEETKDAPPPTPKPETVKLLVPAADLTAGTKLTDEVLKDKFKEVEYPKGLLPDTVATDAKDLGDKYLQGNVAADVPVAKSALGKEAPKKPEPPTPPENPGGKKGGVDDATGTPKGGPEDPPVKVEPPKEKKTYVDVKVQTPTGTKVLRYEKLKGGDHKFVGEVTGNEPTEPTDGKKDESEKKKRENSETSRVTPQYERLVDGGYRFVGWKTKTPQPLMPL